MRSSSIKSIVAAVSISITVLAAVPVATAGTAQRQQKNQTTRTRETAPSTDRFATFRELVNRTLRRIGVQTGISIPTPRTDEEQGMSSPQPNQPNEPEA